MKKYVYAISPALPYNLVALVCAKASNEEWEVVSMASTPVTISKIKLLGAEQTATGYVLLMRKGYDPQKEKAPKSLDLDLTLKEISKK